MEELESDIDTYKQQLAQINETIEASGLGQDQELQALKEQLEQLIDIATQSLLEQKKAQLLALLNEDEPKEESETNTEAIETREEPPGKDLESMVGQKCSAPFKSSAFASKQYHNAVIYGYEDASEARDLADIHVKVVFSLPVELAMVACPFFMEGKCRFSDVKCKYSHGELVSLSDLKEYVEPDYSYVKEGISVLAKRSSSLIWEHASIDLVSGNEVVVKWSGSVIETLPFEKIWPLSDNEEDFAINTSILNDDSDIVLRIDSSAEVLGGWEQHTKGMGSKLMAKMGYIFGSGLGKSSEGRVEPVPTVIYPMGKSLDWCLEMRNGAKNMEEVAKMQSQKRQAQYEKKLLRESKRKKEEEAVFDFINSACKRSNLTKDEETLLPSTSSKNAKSDNIQVKGLQLDHSMGKIKQDIARLEQSAARLKGKDNTAWKSVQEKLSLKKVLFFSCKVNRIPLSGQRTAIEIERN